MDFVAVVDQVIALLRQRGRVTYRTLKRQFQLDDDALEDLKDELIYGQRLAVDEAGRGPGLDRRRWHRSRQPPQRPRRPRTGTPRLHPALSGGENPHLPQRPGRRAQAGHGAVCRPQGLHGVAGRPRPRGGAAAPRSGAGAHDGGRAPLRRHRQPGHGRWHHGPVWGAAGA